jgi:3-hydroxyisobutyrate dehydrogenase
MASHLYQKINSPLIICDINQNAINQFISLHKSTLSKKPILHANSPIEVARKASTIITMLPSSPHVKKVYLEEEDSLINGIDENSFLIDSSTIDQSVSKEVSKKIIDKGARAVDAPVSGGK